MKSKKILTLFIATILLISSSAFAASASYDPSIKPEIFSVTTRASSYLEGYGIMLVPKSNGRMDIDVSVDGTGKMDTIGVRDIYIEKKVNGKWVEFDSVYAAEHPEFFEKNSTDYLGEYSFYGTSGVQYRATATVYASKGGGWDTGSITSYTRTCK